MADVYGSYAVSERKRAAWSAKNAGNQAIRAELLRSIVEVARTELAGEAAVLDIGCGTGWCLAALAGDGVARERLHGVELSEARAEAARRRVPGAKVRSGDARKLPFDAGQFGLALLLTVLSSMQTATDVRHALGEARRVLAPGGLLLCYEPRVPNPFNRNTRLIRARDFSVAGANPVLTRSLTVAPPLARALTGRVPLAYAILASIPPLKTHRLIAHRRS